MTSQPKPEEVFSIKWVRENTPFLSLVMAVAGGGIALTTQVADLASAQDRTTLFIEAHAVKPAHDGTAIRNAITDTQISEIQRRLGSLERGQRQILDQTGEVLAEFRLSRGKK